MTMEIAEVLDVLGFCPEAEVRELSSPKLGK